jgi:hypothetical protein
MIGIPNLIGMIVAFLICTRPVIGAIRGSCNNKQGDFMNKIVSYAILAVSIAIIIIGFSMSNAVKTTVYPYFSGGMSGVTLAMLGIGGVGFIVAIVGLIRGSKQE